MSRNNVNMEDHFRSQFENYSVDPSPGLWSKVQAKILWKQFFSFRVKNFNVYYLTAALVLITGGVLLISSSLRESVSFDERNSIEKITVPIMPPQDTKSPTGETLVESVQPSVDSPAGLQDTSEDTLAASKVVKNSESGTRDKQAELKSHASPESKTDEKSGNVKEVAPTAKIAFSANQTSGCAPLAVEFTNASENAERYHWTFGDGGSSSEKDPSYVFDESGDYSVILRMTGKDGLEYMKQQTIRVFETPRALFEIENNNNLTGPVYFYNYSKSAQNYEWDFGDQQKSSLSDPVHYYDRPGTYHVKLKVWNDKQCFDSLVIFNAFSGLENDIRFPNAFTPNLSGPSGGYYNENEMGNTIFHPVVNGELIEYQLKIFNRIGFQVFESSDIEVGWDGYYQDELAPQGVYIWKVRGKFSNGETIVQSGDVTLLKIF